MSRPASAGSVTSYNSFHATVCPCRGSRATVEGTAVVSLLNLVQDSSADFVVAGAYGHSRLGEWMFGGMTQGLLERSPVCLLLSH